MKYILISLFYITPSWAITGKAINKICSKEKYDRCGLVVAIANVESGLNALKFNSERSGSYGLLQVQCTTAKQLGLKLGCSSLFKPEINIKYGIKYLKWLMRRKYSLKHLIAAYNAGHVRNCYTPQLCYIHEYSNYVYVEKVLKNLLAK